MSRIKRRETLVTNEVVEVNITATEAKAERREEAEARATLKRNAQDQIDHLDKMGLTATKERARLNKLLENK